ncbi:MAG: TIM barrel protein [bacterium]|nr:TIM barrel protein [bacterium]
MQRFFVGTAGIPHSTVPKNGEDPTSAGIRTIRELKLDAMELEFVNGVYLKPEKTIYVKEMKDNYNVVLTAHAPYFLNLGNPEKVEMSKSVLIHTLKIAELAGIKSIAFHPAYYFKQNPEETFKIVKKAISDILEFSRKNGYKVELRPETAGKTFQFGSIQELIKLCKEIEGLKICIDFAHIYSRSRGEVNGYDGFMRVIENLWKELGDSALKDMHCHVEGIQFGKTGEIRHLNFSESGFDYRGLAQALLESRAEGIIICESPSLESDAILLKELLS